MKLFETAFILHMEDCIPGIKTQRTVAIGAATGLSLGNQMIMGGPSGSYTAKAGESTYVLTAPGLILKIIAPAENGREWRMQYRFNGWEQTNGVMNLVANDQLKLTNVEFLYTELGHRNLLQFSSWAEAVAGIQQQGAQKMLKFFIVPDVNEDQSPAKVSEPEE